MQKPCLPTRDELVHRLRPAGQQHVLAHWEQLTDAQRGNLAQQILGLDLALLGRLHAGRDAAEAWAQLAERADAPAAFRLDDVARGGAARGLTPAAARARGEQALAAGKVAVILVAGGQGTRLGFEHPKGMYPIGPLSQSTLFQILLEKIVARSRRHGVRLPLYLMTSPATHDETIDYLARQRRFGMAEEDVRVFCQGTMPAVDAASGKLLLAAPDSLALSPDGHGGMLAALAASGNLADLRRRGIEYVFYLQIDNPLVVMCDPLTIGYHVLSGSELTTIVVAKRHLRDKLGNVVSIDGKLRILEYSDLNPLGDEVLARRAADGQPVFWAGNTGFHVLDVAFLARAAEDAAVLPFHVARKVVPYVDERGQRVEPERPNACKFERFVFDLLPLAEHAVVVEADRQATFAPVKNGPGDPVDSPETVRAQMVALHRAWLRAAGAQVADDVAVEIGPLAAQDEADLAGRVPPGLVVSAPRYFAADFSPVGRCRT